jgi:hypothetical protein
MNTYEYEGMCGWTTIITTKELYHLGKKTSCIPGDHAGRFIAGFNYKVHSRVHGFMLVRVYY